MTIFLRFAHNNFNFQWREEKILRENNVSETFIDPARKFGHKYSFFYDILKVRYDNTLICMYKQKYTLKSIHRNF